MIEVCLLQLWYQLCVRITICYLEIINLISHTKNQDNESARPIAVHSFSNLYKPWEIYLGLIVKFMDYQILIWFHIVSPKHSWK